MTGRSRTRRYLLTQQGYYPGVVAKNFDVWDWSALNEGTMFQDSAKTLRVDRDALGNPVDPDGKPVGCWTDRVKLTDATQVTTANKPTYDAGSLNGLPTLSFDGGDLLATTNITMSTFAIWVVLRNTTETFVYEYSDSATTVGMYYYTRTTNSQFLVKQTAGNSNAAYVFNVTDGVTRTLRAEFDGTARQYINNSLVATGAATTSTEVTDILHIGARKGGTLAMTGNIAHLCIVSPYPTPAIIASMESYINGIWGVY